MFASRCAVSRQLCRLALALVLVAILVALVTAEPAVDDAVDGASAVPSTEEPAVDELGEKVSSDPYEYLRRYNLADLKKYVFDTYEGKVNIDAYTTTEPLVQEVIRLEEKEDRLSRLKQKVEQILAERRRREVNGGEPDDAAKPNPNNAEEGVLAADVEVPRRGGGGRRRQSPAPLVFNVTFSVCFNSGYESVVRSMEKELQWPMAGLVKLNVTVERYEPSRRRFLLSSVARTGFIMALLLAVAGNYLLPPAVYQQLLQRKGMLFSTGMILNMLATTILQTGAFELFVQGALVYSKLQMGRLPTPEEVSELVLNQTLLHLENF